MEKLFFSQSAKEQNFGKLVFDFLPYFEEVLALVLMLCHTSRSSFFEVVSTNSIADVFEFQKRETTVNKKITIILSHPKPEKFIILIFFKYCYNFQCSLSVILGSDITSIFTFTQFFNAVNFNFQVFWLSFVQSSFGSNMAQTN